jgi:hypothetical protein
MKIWKTPPILQQQWVGGIYTCKTCIHTWIDDSTYLIHTHFAQKKNRNVIETLIPLCHNNKVLKFKFVPHISKLICYVIIKGVLGLLTLNQDLRTYLFGNVTLLLLLYMILSCYEGLGWTQNCLFHGTLKGCPLEFETTKCNIVLGEWV